MGGEVPLLLRGVKTGIDAGCDTVNNTGRTKPTPQLVMIFLGETFREIFYSITWRRNCSLNSGSPESVIPLSLIP